MGLGRGWACLAPSKWEVGRRGRQTGSQEHSAACVWKTSAGPERPQEAPARGSGITVSQAHGAEARRRERQEHPGSLAVKQKRESETALETPQ